MKKFAALLLFVCLSWAFGGKVKASGIPATNPTDVRPLGATAPSYPHLSDYLLTADDLLPLCEWQQGPIITRPVAQGILSYTGFRCGTDPNVRSVRIFILFAPRLFTPGDANAFTTMNDVGFDEPTDIGVWSKSTNTIFDYRSLVFTKANALVYIGPGGGYYDSYPPTFDLAIDLAEIVEERLPDEFIPLEIASRTGGESVEPEASADFFIEEPQMAFSGEENILIVPSAAPTRTVHFSVQYADPHETYIELCRQGDEQCVKSWHFHRTEKLSSTLNDEYPATDMMDIFFTIQEMDTFFLADGDYTFRVWADDALIVDYPFTTETN